MIDNKNFCKILGRNRARRVKMAANNVPYPKKYQPNSLKITPKATWLAKKISVGPNIPNVNIGR